MILSATTETIQISKAAGTTTTSPDCYAAYVDVTTTTFVPGVQRTSLSGGAGVDSTVVSAPAASTQRQVKYMTIFNRDTVTHTFEVQHDLSGTDFFMARIVLLANEMAEYVWEKGWTIHDTSGIVKENIAVGIETVAASGGTITSGQVSFQNSNGIEFGVNGNTITAREIPIRVMEPAPAISSRAMGQGTMYLQYVPMHAPMTLHQIGYLMHVSNSASAGGTVSFHAGLYSQTGSTFSLASSSSYTWGYNSTAAASSYTVISGTRLRIQDVGAWNASPGDWWLGLAWSVSTSGTSGSYTNFLNQSAVSVVGVDFGTLVPPAVMDGIYSAATNALPASMNTSQIVRTGSAFAAQPYIRMYNTVAP
jgi:hypothetical protein